jgi:hypothetical protein
MTQNLPLEVFVLQDEPGAAVALRRPEPTGDVPPRAMVGTVEMLDGVPQWDSVTLRDSFVALYREHMQGKKGPKPAILDQAKVKPGDYVYVIDGRVKTPGGKVPFHEIIGWYKSDHRGRPVADTFEYNAKHRPYSEGRASSMLSDPAIRAIAYKP